MIGNVNLLHKLQFLYFSVLIVAILLLLAFLFSTIEDSSAQAEQKNFSDDEQAISVSDDPNVITAGMLTAANETEKTIIATENTASNLLQSVGGTVSQSGDFAAQSTRSLADNAASGTVAIGRKTGNLLGSVTPTLGNGLKFTVNGVGSGVGSAAGALGNGFGSAAGAISNGFGSAAGAIASGAGYVLSLPGAALEFISNSAIVTAVIRPADHSPVPIIDPNSPALKEARLAMNTNPSHASQTDSTPAWPIHGKITTHFGVNHWPYQATHTGIDISDGKSSGVTAVKPFKPGRVIETVKSSKGLGNHVVIDHGSGVTSVYAHLASISVHAGETVDKNTTLGLVGSTGVSTGPHVHFEIRVNGKAADPRHFISGHP
ncbi:M23 family metallopeptidase [Candidatus Parcubacteria bacterium]|nr:M23 family metallopeptidase [Candidatus Parcubacteria bacterium]